MLIDLDLAVLVNEHGKNETSEERNMTGTLEYMAIQILEGAIRKETAGTDHTYWHDLESFFYVFLSLCIRYGYEKGKEPKTDSLKAWYEGNFESICKIKNGELEPRGFEIYILGQFSPKFQAQKELARNLRTILFGKGALYVETPQKPATLYDPIIKAFKDAVQEIRW
jgi:Fungal protein kinase